VDDVVSMLAATATVNDVLRGRWVVVADGLVLDGYHPQARAGALVATDYDASAVVDGTVDLRKGYRASSIAHSDNGE
jgi:hypothetical protein